VTCTSTCPAAWAGATAMITPEPLTVNEAAATPPKVTAVAPVKLLPKIITVVPPADEPMLVPRLLTAGVGVWNVNWSDDDAADVPPGVVTCTSTCPAE